MRLARHEAMVFGLDAPSKMEVAAGLMGSPVDKEEEEIDARLARLTQQERDLFMRKCCNFENGDREGPERNWAARFQAARSNS